MLQLRRIRGEPNNWFPLLFESECYVRQPVIIATSQLDASFLPLQQTNASKHRKDNSQTISTLSIFHQILRMSGILIGP